MRILITGIGGFVGGHLAELLSRGPHEIVGVVRPGKSPEVIKPLSLSKAVHIREADLADESAVKRLVIEVRPNAVIHLSGHARNVDGEKDYFQRANVEATKTLCEAVVSQGHRARILIVSTGLVYGDLNDPNRDGFDESMTLDPHGDYAKSKAQAEHEALLFHQKNDLDVVIVRPFNHTGPRQTTEYPIPKFAKQIVEIKSGSKGVIRTRDLSHYRDYCDVRDVASAYQLLLERADSGGIYNVGSGRTYTMREIVDRLIVLAGVDAIVDPDPPQASAGNLHVTKCNSRKLEALGWQRKYSLDETLRDVLSYWKK